MSEEQWEDLRALILTLQTHVVLLGMMGVGKSRIGNLLARRLHMPFIDLDQVIEKHLNRSISEVFEDVGESGFRAIETAALKRILDHPCSVIALGGGAYTVEDNRVWVKERSVTVWLDVDLGILHRRLLGSRKRPLVAQLSSDELEVRLKTLMEERQDAYALADLRVRGEQGSPIRTLQILGQQLTCHLESIVSHTQRAQEADLD